MDMAAPKLVFLFLLSTPVVCSSDVFLWPLWDIEHKERGEQKFHSWQRMLVTTLPPTPVKVTVPTDTSSPGFVTIPPATTPGAITPTPPSTPVTATPTTPPTNPSVPVTNPVNSVSPPGGVPVATPAVPPPVAPNAPAVAGQKWCVAKSGVPETSLQGALDYACGTGGADCSAIQQGASCYNPNTLQNHASYAFNSYYQKNPGQTSCDFGGAAALTNVNPSSGSCVYPTSSSSKSPTTPPPTTTTPTPPSTTKIPPPPPTIASPTTKTPPPPPTTASPTTTTPSSAGAPPTGSVTPPTIVNAGNPGFEGSPTGFGEIPATGSTTSVSMSGSPQPFTGCIILLTAIITGKIILDI